MSRPDPEPTQAMIEAALGDAPGDDDAPDTPDRMGTREFVVELVLRCLDASGL